MLQLQDFYDRCYQEFHPMMQKNPKQTPEQGTDDLFAYIDTQRKIKSEKAYYPSHFPYFLDSLVWTKKIEYLDQDRFSFAVKRKIVKALNFKNDLFGTYSTSFKILAPMIKKINEEEKRPARILELAAGMGDFATKLMVFAQKHSLQVKITSSDIVPEYMDEASKEAKKKGFSTDQVEFKIIDAYALDQLPPRSYDIAFTLHSLHHFTPGQLCRMIAGSQKIVTTSFIGIDGYRGLLNLAFIISTGSLGSLFNASFMHAHDATLSGRKMYAHKQLEMIARIGCPQSSIMNQHLKPGLTLLSVSSKI
jgi:hypothetical protein